MSIMRCSIVRSTILGDDVICVIPNIAYLRTCVDAFNFLSDNPECCIVLDNFKELVYVPLFDFRNQYVTFVSYEQMFNYFKLLQTNED